MATLDLARRRVALDAVELEAAVFLVSGGGPVPEPLRAGVRGLEDGGALRGGRMADVLAELVGVMAAPALEVVIETQVVGPPVVTLLYGTPEHAVLVGNPTADLWVLSPVEPRNLPFAMSMVLGFGSRPAPALEWPLEIPGAALETAYHAAAAQDEGAVARALGGLAAGEREAATALLLRRRLSWRVTVTWNDDGGRAHRGGLAIVDGGEAGMWETGPLDAARPTAGVRLAPLRSSDVWTRLMALVPPPRSRGSRGLVEGRNASDPDHRVRRAGGAEAG